MNWDRELYHKTKEKMATEGYREDAEMASDCSESISEILTLTFCRDSHQLQTPLS